MINFCRIVGAFLREHGLQGAPKVKTFALRGQIICSFDYVAIIISYLKGNEFIFRLKFQCTFE